MKKIMIVFGTRPEAIKLCPLIIELKRNNSVFKTVVCVTAQHREMLDQILNIFSVIPDYDLNLMRDNQDLFDITTLALSRLGEIIKQEKPDMIVAQGDTTTTFAASLAAYYNRIQVSHVEAGLRTYKKYAPFPEEINRRLTSHIADLHFAPTTKSMDNLIAEGIASEQIEVTGNTVIDALLWMKNEIISGEQRYNELDAIDFSKRIILITGHRRESFGKGFIRICRALNTIAERNRNVELVYPVHLNPNVKKPVYDYLSDVENIKLLSPLSYPPFVFLMNKSYFIISDSGGVQEEAPSLGKPVLVTRDTTERPEAVEAGVVKLVGTDEKTIISEAENLIFDNKAYSRMANKKNPYGDGQASVRIVTTLKKHFS